MRRLIISVLATTIVLSLSACGGSTAADESREPSSTLEERVTNETRETTEPENETPTQEGTIKKEQPEEIAVSGKCEKPYEIITHPQDGEYFYARTNNWIWQSGSSEIDEIIGIDGLLEMQKLICYMDTGESYSVSYKFVYGDNETAQTAYDRMLENPYGYTSYHLVNTAVCDNVVYMTYGTYQREMSREIAHIEGDGSMKTYGIGLYANIMAGGDIWDKYITSAFDGMVNDGGEAPSLPVVSLDENK